MTAAMLLQLMEVFMLLNESREETSFTESMCSYTS